MTILETRFQTELAKLLTATRDAAVNDLTNPAAVEDYAKYRDMTGYLRALSDVEGLINDVARKLGDP